MAKFQSTRPIRGATIELPQPLILHLISIHAPHTGRDDYPVVVSTHTNTISIHAPHTGRDLSRLQDYHRVSRFQSTRPIRGATLI